LWLGADLKLSIWSCLVGWGCFESENCRGGEGGALEGDELEPEEDMEEEEMEVIDEQDEREPGCEVGACLDSAFAFGLTD